MILVFTLATFAPEIVEIKYVRQEPYQLIEYYDDEAREFKYKCISYVDEIPPVKVVIE